MVLIVSKDEVRSVLSINEAINAVEGAFTELTLGTAKIPRRVSRTSTRENTLFKSVGL